MKRSNSTRNDRRRAVHVDVTSLGELLIDFTPFGTNRRGAMLFAKNPGGAPANVLAAVSRLGGKNLFIGKVGDDAFGAFLRKTLDGLGVSTEGLAVSQTVHTTMAFVQLDEKGDRSFSFYRSPGADMVLAADEVRENLIKESRIFHFGSVSMTSEPARGSTLHAARFAREHGCIVSFDPNYRPLLWEDEPTAKEQMLQGAALADIVKVSGEKLALLTGETDPAKGSLKLTENGASLVLVSLGRRGAFFRRGGVFGTLPTYDVQTVDTTGAGDAFLGAALYLLKSKSLSEVRGLSAGQLKDIVGFANAADSLAMTALIRRISSFFSLSVTTALNGSNKTSAPSTLEISRLDSTGSTKMIVCAPESLASCSIIIPIMPPLMIATVSEHFTPHMSIPCRQQEIGSASAACSKVVLCAII